MITNRIQNGRDDAGNDIRIRQPESEWKRRQDESLRIVSDELWDAAHARIQKTKASYLRRGHQLVGQVESTKGLYTLSGFLVCSLCHKPLIATRRGRNQSAVFICREHRERQTCSNATGVPMEKLTLGVIKSMNETFTEQTFRRHLENQAADTAARDQRAAERAGLITDLPKLATAEQRLVKRIATVEDDALVAALKTEWSEAKGKREVAEQRLAQLEGIERDLAADVTEVEAMLAKWGEWSKILAQAVDAPIGSAPVAANDIARQVLKKVLVGPIVVTPAEATPVDTLVGRVIAENLDEKLPEAGWTFFGYTRFEGVIGGGLRHGHSTSIDFRGHDGRPLSHHLVTIEDIDRMQGRRPIAGGSDAGVLDRRDTDMAPIPPPTLGARSTLRAPPARAVPAKAWRAPFGAHVSSAEARARRR